MSQSGIKMLIELSYLLKKKKLSPALFDSSKHSIQFEDGLDEHVKWAYNNIYNTTYPGDHEEWHGIRRYFHGIEHVTRAALYIPVFINLYRKHGDPDALNLTDEDVKLLQLAALFHDSGREAEGIDKWDNESAMLLYSYLTLLLGVDATKAKLISEAIANKDISPDGYFKIINYNNGKIEWRWKAIASDHPKNIYQKIIHDADCLEIIRARDAYDASYLDFYTNIASLADKQIALEEMAHLICEARSLITIQGDAPNEKKSLTKKKYEHENAYAAIKADISPQRHPIMHALQEVLAPERLVQELIHIPPYNKANELTENNLRAAIYEGKVYARGIPLVSAVNERKKIIESDAALELRKTMRTKGVPTRTTTSNCLKKEGNLFRSLSLMGYGAALFTNVGFGIVDPDIKRVSKVYGIDSDSGFGKKSHFKHQQKPSETTIQNQLQKIIDKRKLGGEARTYPNNGYHCAYAEILYDILDYQFIFYSNDSTIMNKMHYNHLEPVHRYAPLLQAIYLQKLYEREYERTKIDFITHLQPDAEEKHRARFPNKTLPIFLYSGTHNEIKKVSDEDLRDENIVKMWVEMCEYYLIHAVRPSNNNIFELPASQLKVLAMYEKTSAGAFGNKKECTPADDVYDQNLQDNITQAINEARNYLRAQLREKTFATCDNANINDPADRELLVSEVEASNKLCALLIDESSEHNALIKDILLLAKFKKQHIEKNMSDLYKIQIINEFYKEGIDIILSNNTNVAKEQALRQLANVKFSPPDMGLRILADALMLISVIFLAIGIYRVYQGHSFFLSSHITEENKNFTELLDNEFMGLDKMHVVCPSTPQAPL